MALIGWLATVAIGIVLLVVIFVVVSALPDLSRYRRLRKM
jgi:membrane protein YdbS with pleckstrin-like domain